MRLRRAIAVCAVGLAGCTPALDPQMRAHELSLAVDGATSFAAWHGGMDDASAIYVQRIDATGHFSGTPHRISNGKRLAYEPDLILGRNQLVLAWYEKDPATRQLGAQLASASQDGELLWSARLGDPKRTARNPVVRIAGGRIHVAWIEQATTEGPDNRAEVWHQIFSPDGKAETSAARIGEANRDTWNLNATVSGDRFILVYDAALGTKAHELQMLVLDGRNARHVQLSGDDGKASLYPDLQVDASGNAALTWFDEKDGNREIYLQIAPFDALGISARPGSIRVTHNDGESIGAYAAWNGGIVGLAWSDERAGRRELFTQQFDAKGDALAPSRQLGRSEGRASVPAIRASGSGFLVAWNDYVAPAGNGHGAQSSSQAKLAWVAVDQK